MSALVLVSSVSLHTFNLLYVVTQVECYLENARFIFHEINALSDALFVLYSQFLVAENICRDRDATPDLNNYPCSFRTLHMKYHPFDNLRVLKSVVPSKYVNVLKEGAEFIQSTCLECRTIDLSHKERSSCIISDDAESWAQTWCYQVNVIESQQAGINGSRVFNLE